MNFMVCVVAPQRPLVKWSWGFNQSRPGVKTRHILATKVPTKAATKTMLRPAPYRW
jgi:hypothetical protein